VLQLYCKLQIIFLYCVNFMLNIVHCLRHTRYFGTSYELKSTVFWIARHIVWRKSDISKEYIVFCLHCQRISHARNQKQEILYFYFYCTFSCYLSLTNPDLMYILVYSCSYTDIGCLVIEVSLSNEPNRVGVSHPLTWGRKQIQLPKCCVLSVL
jgi:hypothetical protein